jgi:hypothetical protein
MVTMMRMDGFKIEVRTDHNPPHFHVTAADADLMIDLRTFEIMAGSAPRKVAEKALEWAREHRDELLAKWSELNERE